MHLGNSLFASRNFPICTLFGFWRFDDDLIAIGDCKLVALAQLDQVAAVDQRRDPLHHRVNVKTRPVR